MNEFQPYVSGMSRRQFVITGMLAAAGLTVAACGGGAATGGGSGTNVLRAGQSGELRGGTLDPAKTAPEISSLAYDPLIQEMPDGSLAPRLATAWRYVGTGNTTFELSLRPNVKFSDGTPFNANAVKANLDRYRDPKLGSQAQQYLKPVSEVEVVDELTARLHLSEPHPLLPQVLASHTYLAGFMVSPAAFDDEKKLVLGTFGAGPYVLDATQTIQGDHYTYVPNPSYWNKGDVPWKQIILSFRPDENSTISALQAGQLDSAVVSYATIGAAKQAGLQAVGPGTSIVLGLSLWDRDGVITPPLRDVRVRQALNYAVDRQKIAKALVGDAGMPTDQLSSPTQDGWNANGYYNYDVAKAKQLLTAAGVAGGFSIPVRTTTGDFLDRVMLALQDDLNQIGVKLEVSRAADFDQSDAASNSKFGAGLIGWGIAPAYLMGRSFWLPDATNNPFHSNDQTLVDLDKRAAQESQPQARAALDKQIVGRVAELAWFLPAFLYGEFVVYHGDAVQIPSVQPGQDLPQYPFYRPVSR